MHRIASIGLAVVLAGTGLPALAGEQPPQPISDLVATLLPEVVNIATTRGKATEHQMYSIGSGFIIDPSGIIVTNEHVIKGADEIIVSLQDNTRLRASVLYQAPIDMAILQVHSDKPLPAVKWGDSDLIRPGDPVFAIGSPLGLGGSVTAGIVSATDRDIHETPYDAFIQTDAAINHGNSGGPLFNAAGEVVGINTALYSGNDTETGSIGLGFAIPSEDAQFVIGEWRKFGRVRPGWIGTEVQPVTPDIADAAGLSPPRGVIVAAVAKGSPADAAHIEQGDIILKVGDTDILHVRGLNRAVGRAPLDQAVPIELWRDGAAVSVQATVREDPSMAGPDKAAVAAQMAAANAPLMPYLSPSDVGVRLAPVTDALRKQFGLAPGQQGLVTTNVMAGSIAADHGIQPGDVLVKVGNHPVASTEELQTLVKSMQAAQQHHILMLIQDQHGPRWISMPLFRETP